MRTMRSTVIALLIAATAASWMPGRASAALVIYGQTQRDAWFADAGAVETITFTEHPLGQLTTQYQESHGLTVTGSGWVGIMSLNLSFPNDGHGLLTFSSDAVLHFDRPMQALGMDFPGIFWAELYMDDLYMETVFLGLPGIGNFRGIISSLPFNRVRMYDVDGDFGIDDLHFAPMAVPAPGAAALLIPLAWFMRRGRRRPRHLMMAR
ncbi:MAG: hypothetical protein KF817_14955 [Phycisphaeraceae bacterium]|nr:hypothetical protein [Phycisphaeraceae bacterium]